MTVSTLKEQLHAYINSADKKMFDKRRSAHLKDESKSYSVSEVRKYAVSKINQI